MAGKLDTQNVKQALAVNRGIHEIYVLSDAYDRHALSQFNLTNSEFRLLSQLGDDRGIRLTTLSERLLLNKSTVTRLVNSLEQSGWATRAPDHDDGRAQRAKLTPEGRRRLAKAAKAYEESLEARMQSLDGSERRLLHELLDKLAVGLREKLVD